MCLSSRLLASCAALALLTVAPANAADYDPPIYIEEAPEYVPVEIGSGWYLRGDIAYNFNARHATDTYTDGPVTHDSNFRDSVSAGGGFGYRFTDFLRADATIDRVFGSDFSSRTPVAPQGPCNGWGEVTQNGVTFLDMTYDIDNCMSEDSARYDTWLMMGNVYADLGTFAGFTPFVGGGLGAARVTWREETDSITCIPEDAAVHFEGCSASGSLNQPQPNTIYTEPGIQNAGTDYRFAWSVTGGLSYLINPNLHLDTSYRYTSVAGSNREIVYNNTPGSSMARDGFALHQVKVGLRYDLW